MISFDRTYRFLSRALVALPLIVTVPIISLAADAPPAIGPDGLHLVPDTKIGVVYVDPEADFSGYTKVKLDTAEVSFKKNWARD